MATWAKMELNLWFSSMLPDRFSGLKSVLQIQKCFFLFLNSMPVIYHSQTGVSLNLPKFYKFEIRANLKKSLDSKCCERILYYNNYSAQDMPLKLIQFGRLEYSIF